MISQQIKNGMALDYLFLKFYFLKYPQVPKNSFYKSKAPTEVQKLVLKLKINLKANLCRSQENLLELQPKFIL